MCWLALVSKCVGGGGKGGGVLGSKLVYLSGYRAVGVWSIGWRWEGDEWVLILCPDPAVSRGKGSGNTNLNSWACGRTEIL